MSYTESGRLAQLQQTIRACTINDKIAELQAQRSQTKNRVYYGNSNAAGYGNSESGRIGNVLAALGPGGVCYVAEPTLPSNCSVVPSVSQFKTVQSEGSYIQTIRAAAEACGPTPLQNRISAGGITESQRLQRLQDSIINVDYSVNPDARFLKYQRFFPTPCPPAPVANNQPLTQPRFQCAPNIVGFT